MSGLPCQPLTCHRHKPTEAGWPAYDTVKKWTKATNVFDKRFIIVPINESFHWFLAVIFNPSGVLQQKSSEPSAPRQNPGSGHPVTRAALANLEARTTANARSEGKTGSRSQDDDPDKDPLDCISEPIDDIECDSRSRVEMERVSNKVGDMSIEEHPPPAPQPIQSDTLQLFNDQWSGPQEPDSGTATNVSPNAKSKRSLRDNRAIWEGQR